MNELLAFLSDVNAPGLIAGALGAGLLYAFARTFGKLCKGFVAIPYGVGYAVSKVTVRPLVKLIEGIIAAAKGVRLSGKKQEAEKPEALTWNVAKVDSAAGVHPIPNSHNTTIGYKAGDPMTMAHTDLPRAFKA